MPTRLLIHCLRNAKLKMTISDTYQLEIKRNEKSIKIIENLYGKYDRNVFEFDNNASNEEMALRNKEITKQDWTSLNKA